VAVWCGSGFSGAEVTYGAGAGAGALPNTALFRCATKVLFTHTYLTKSFAT